MAYLVTGGTGLIGSRIVRDLVRGGEQAIVYDWLPEGRSLERLLSGDEIEKKVRVVQGDVTDLPHLLHVIKENNVKKVIHTAGLLTLECSANPPLAIRVNCEGTVNIFEAARLLGLGKVVWSSSSSVFGRPENYTEECIPNDALHCPQNIYGATKSFNEIVADHYFHQYGVDITALRYPVVYGPGQVHGGGGMVMRELVFNPALGKPGRVPASDSAVGWSYVDDVARASVLASKVARTKTGAYSMNGYLHTMKEVADYVKKLLPGADITLVSAGAAASGTSQIWKYDTSLIEEEIGYRPEWPMERGIKETIDIVRREHGLPAI